MRDSFHDLPYHRRSIRLRDYDYTAQGAYYITVCSEQRAWSFGNIIDGVMHVNQIGTLVEQCWDEIPAHFPQVETDAFVVMPNHVHGIIVIKADDGSPVGARHAVPLRPPEARRFGQAIPGSLAAIVGSFKSAVTRRVNMLRETPGAPVWQRNYYETVIRNEAMLNTIRQYIETNPARWANDTENIHPF